MNNKATAEQHTTIVVPEIDDEQLSAWMQQVLHVLTNLQLNIEAIKGGLVNTARPEQQFPTY